MAPERGSRPLTQPLHPAVLHGFSYKGSAHVDLSDNVDLQGFSSLLSSPRVSAGTVSLISVAVETLQAG